jgi:hypothetical protein
VAVNTHPLPAPAAPDVEMEPVLGPQERLYRSGGWLTVLLALCVLLSVAASIQAANWTDGLVVVQTVVLGGAVVGFLLALTSWGTGFTVFYSFLASVAWIITCLVRTILQSPNLHDGVLQLYQHTNQWILALMNGTASGDNLIFVIQLCILGWWMAHFTMWSLIRHQRVWHAVAPAAVGLLINAYYAPTDVTPYVVVFLIAVVLLAVRVELARNEARWQMAHIRYAPDMYLDFLKEGLIFAVVVVTLAWMLPSVGTPGTKLDQVIQPLQQPWHQVQDNWQRMFTSLRYRPSAGVSTYGKSLKLGGPVSLTDRPVFQAQVPIRSYWRGAAFDTYTGQQWVNTDQTTVSVDGNGALNEPRFSATGLITATIHTLENGQNVLFGAPQPLRTTLPVNADVSPLAANGTSSSADSQEQVLVSMLRSRIDLRQDSVYQVTSAVPLATPDQLRADSTSYPAWVRQRFLQIPSEMPARVRQKADEVTAGMKTPYDKAAALEAYLRTFPYNTQIPAPPEGMDGVDYFLFDIKQGYCDYYASAMVMMLRMEGVPARFVAGYAPGEYNKDTNTYLVREENAHAWVEVFFPTYGWVQFEPTASQPLIERPKQQVPSRSIISPQPNVPGGQEQSDYERLMNMQRRPGGAIANLVPMTSPIMIWLDAYKWDLLGVVLAALIIAGAVLFFRSRQRRFFSADNGLIVRMFGLIGSWADRLGVPWPASHTPWEHAHAFSTVLPEAGEPINRLTGLLMAQQYGAQEPAPEALQGVVSDWRSMQPVLWKRWINQHAPRWPRKKA